MKTKKFLSKKFMHEYFHIPMRLKTDWCIIAEYVNGEQNLRIGLQIVDTSLYLDIAHRRFYTTGRCGQVVREIYPASFRIIGEYVVFTGQQQSLYSVTLPKTFAEDIFYPALYSPQLLDDRLL